MDIHTNISSNPIDFLSSDFTFFSLIIFLHILHEQASLMTSYHRGKGPRFLCSEQSTILSHFEMPLTSFFSSLQIPLA